MLDESPAGKIRRFAASLAGTDIAQLEFRTAHGDIFLVRRDVGAAGTAAPDIDESAPATAVAASSVGIFLRQHPLRDTPLVEAGQDVAAGQIIGFLRIGALLLPVAAARDGVVLDVPAAHGDLVGYGATLIRLLPD